jgi:acetyltransferase-like isoleucine patch superfamily enzyme
MKIPISSIPSQFFVNPGASTCHPESYLELEDPRDLDSRCNLRIVLLPSCGHTLRWSIKIGKISGSLNATLYLSNSEIEFGPGSCGTWDIRSWHNSRFFLKGDNISCHGARCVLEHESEICIGRDCMLSDDVLIQCGSQHSIINLKDRRQLNTLKSVVAIEDHVWLGRRSTVMCSSRKLTIGRGSVLGVSSTLTKSLPATSLAAGAPARVIRESISWSNHFRCSQEEIERISSLF